MKVLSYNIDVLATIQRTYGSLDSFVTSDTPYNIAEKLSKKGSRYKLKQVGYALALEYLKNVGIPAIKPDVHSSQTNVES